MVSDQNSFAGGSCRLDADQRREAIDIRSLEEGPSFATVRLPFNSIFGTLSALVGLVIIMVSWAACPTSRYLEKSRSSACQSQRRALQSIRAMPARAIPDCRNSPLRQKSPSAPGLQLGGTILGTISLGPIRWQDRLSDV
jgi:hypothetical protein